MTGIKLDASPLVSALAKEKARRREVVIATGGTLSGWMEAYAKANHPWADRTGRARGAIRGRSEVEGARVRITLTGGAPYSAALETGYGGRYAILGPTVRRFAPELVRALKGEGSA